MQVHTSARRSILFSLAVVIAGIAAAAFHFPRQQAYAAQAQQRARLAQAPTVEVIVDGDYAIDGMAVDARGTLYITEHNGNHVYAIGKAGQRTKFTDPVWRNDDPSGIRTVVIPTTLATDRAGNLYALDASGPTRGCIMSSRLKKIGADGKASTLAMADAAMATLPMKAIMGVAVDGRGAVYLQEYNTVYTVSSTGKLVELPQPDGSSESDSHEHDGAIAAHPDGGVIVANGQDGVYRILPDGRAARLATRGGDCSLSPPAAPLASNGSVCGAGGDGSCANRRTAAQAPTCNINAIAVDARGRIFLSNDARILQVDTDGAITTFFDPAKGTPMPLKNPLQDNGLTMMALGPHGEVYWAGWTTLYKLTPWSRMPRLPGAGKNI